MEPTTIEASTLTSADHNQFGSTRIFVGVAGLIAGGIAVGGILVEGGKGIEQACQPRIELCAPSDLVWLPDEPAEKGPSTPLQNIRIVTTATSTALSPTSMTMLPMSK